MNVNATLFYGGIITPNWQERLRDYEVRPIPPSVPGLRGIPKILQFLRELKRFDKIIIHHHVDPILAFYISKTLGARTVWYSGSMFELAWERWITGEDYRSISQTVKQTSKEYYGSLLSSLLLSDRLFDLTVRTAQTVDVATVRGYSRIIANSRFLSHFLKRIYKLDKQPATVYPGPDPILEELSSKDFVGEDDYMLAVGPLIPLKNVNGMIHAAAQVPSARLLVAGDGQDRQPLLDLAARLNVPFRVNGNSHSEEEMASLYARCKFLVHLSLYEPFGLTPVEAGLFGKPSIVTDHGGPPEVVINDETGFVVNPRDYPTVAKRMTELFESPEVRHEMGRKARRRVLDKFTLEKSAKQLLAEIET